MRKMCRFHSLFAMEREKTKYKILMFPWLAHGHVLPFLQLSKELSSTNNFTIYLCSTSINLDSIESSIDGYQSIKVVALQIPPSPELPPHLHTTKNLPSHLLPTLLQAFQTSRDSFSEIMDSVKPDLLIYDFFQPWAPKIAASKRVPSVCFATSGATSISFYHHLHTMGSGSTFPFKAISVPDEEIDRLRNRIAPNVKDADHADFAFGNFTMSADVVLMKSCGVVEEKYIDYLSSLCKKHIVCTGPLIADDNGKDNKESDDIMKWLSGKSDSSTIYISFGSECFLSKEQIGEIAKALLLCEVNFLWVIRFPTEERESSIEEQLPPGFLEMVKERGLVVSRWAPQTRILKHTSVGGFLSHCGWSSVLESMYFGVPIVAMAIKSEQPINGQLVVEAGAGVGLEKGGGGVYEGGEVANAIKKVMVDKDFYNGLRERARKLSQAMREKEGGEREEVVEKVLRICKKNKSEV